MRRTFLLYMAWVIGFGLCYMSCAEDPDLSTDIKNAAPPEVKLLTGTSAEYKLIKSATSITIEAEVSSANGAPVERYGICWGTTSDVSVETGDTAVFGNGLGRYTATAANLEADHVYYVRPFAVNKKGTSYGDELTVSTNTGLGVVQTMETWTVKAESAFCGGKILDMGEGDITEKGICISTEMDDPSPRKVKMESMENDSSYYGQVGGLTPDTKYYFWAYITNRFGTVKGTVREFTTTSGKPSFSSIALASKDFTSASVRAIIHSAGDSDITEVGFCYSSINTSPSLDDDTSITSKVVCEIANDSIVSVILPDLKQQTTYYVRAYAVNSFGTAYSGGDEDALRVIVVSQAPTVGISDIADTDISNGSLSLTGAILDKGETDIIDAGFCWSEYDSPSLQNGQHVSAYTEGDSILSKTVSGLKGSTKYYVVAYARNSKATSYSEVKTISTPNIITYLSKYNGATVTESSSCMLNGIGYILGGDLGQQYSSQLVSFDTNTETWAGKKSSGDNVKGATLSPLNNTSILRLGGRNDDGTDSNVFNYYSIGQNEWNAMPTSTGETPALFKSSSLVSGKTVYYFGGSIGDAMNTQVYRYEADFESWSVLSTPFPEAQLNSVAVWLGGTAYVGLGMIGNNVSGASYSKRLWSSSSFYSWEEQAECPTSADGIIRGVAVDDILYVLDTDLNMWKYDPESSAWEDMKTSFSQILKGGDFNNVFMFASDDMIYIGLTNGQKTFVKYAPLWDN